MPKRSAHPTNRSTTTSRPVSSNVSRTTARCSGSPGSTCPPGTDHSPWAGPRPRRTRSSASSTIATAPTATDRVGAMSAAQQIHGWRVHGWSVHGWRFHGWSVRCMVSARAVKPLRSKKFFASRCPGRASASTPMQLAIGAEREQRRGDALPHAHGPRLELHEEIGDDAEMLSGAERLDHDHAVPDHHVVDRADHHCRVVAVDQRAVRVGQRLRPRLPATARARHPSSRRARDATGRRARRCAATSALVAARADSITSSARDSGELRDLAQDGVPTAVRRLVATDGLERRVVEPFEALDHLRRRQLVVVGDGQRLDRRRTGGR